MTLSSTTQIDQAIAQIQKATMKQAHSWFRCNHNHHLTPANLYKCGDRWFCKTCRKKNAAEYKQRQAKGISFRPKRSYPSQPLLSLISSQRRRWDHLTDVEFYDAYGLTERAITRMKSTGRVTTRMGEEYSTRLGSHVDLIWTASEQEAA